jgi:uncharacterized protein
MSATYVIDGYNLLHAMGVLGGRAGPHGLEKARGQLVGLLRGGFGEQAGAVTVVFDAAKAPPGMHAELDDRGVHVLFATHHQQADDLIEELVKESSAPKTLEVVSDDHRIQQSAKRRGCKVRGCEEFLAWLHRHRREKGKPAERPEKKNKLSKEDVDSWLAEFADVERDPRLKKAFETFEFETEL